MKPNKNHKAPVAVMLTAGFGLSAPFAIAGPLPDSGIAPDGAAVTVTDEESIFDRIWSAAQLYKADSGILTDLSLQGRLHLQYADGDSSQGDYGSSFRNDNVRWGDTEVRRWRLGVKSKWFDGRVFVKGNINISPELNPFYRSIHDLQLGFNVTDDIKVAIGKTRIADFGHEFHSSSNKLETLERTLLANTLSGPNLTGIDVDGKHGSWLWSIGAYAGDSRPEFTEFDQGAVIQTSVGYDYADGFGFDSADARFEYQLNTDAGNARGNFEHAFALNTSIKKGRYSVWAEAMGGIGRGTQGDVVGLAVSPAYYLIEDRLQFVFRYQYAHGSNDGLRLQSRYERLAENLTDRGFGRDYHAAYAGLNYYLYGHKLKLMTGVEYHNMDGGSDGGDFDGWTWSTALRMYF